MFEVFGDKQLVFEPFFGGGLVTVGRPLHSVRSLCESSVSD